MRIIKILFLTFSFIIISCYSVFADTPQTLFTAGQPPNYASPNLHHLTCHDSSTCIDYYIPYDSSLYSLCFVYLNDTTGQRCNQSDPLASPNSIVAILRKSDNHIVTSLNQFGLTSQMAMRNNLPSLTDNGGYWSPFNSTNSLSLSPTEVSDLMYDSDIVSYNADNTFGSLTFDYQTVQQTNVSTWNFEGYKIVTPTSTAPINSTHFKATTYARIKLGDGLAPYFDGGTDTYIAQQDTQKYFEKFLNVSVGGITVVPHNISYQWFPPSSVSAHGTDPSYYDVSITFDVPVPSNSSGAVDFKVSSSFMSDRLKIFLFVHDTFNDYTDTRSITIIPFSDRNNDGIDDNTGVPKDGPINSPSGPPSRSSYSDDIFGFVQYAFDSFAYWINYIASSISLMFTHLISAFTSVFSGFGSITGFMTSTFSFLPAPILMLMTCAISFAVVGVFLHIFGKR